MPKYKTVKFDSPKELLEDMKQMMQKADERKTKQHNQNIASLNFINEHRGDERIEEINRSLAVLNKSLRDGTEWEKRTAVMMIPFLTKMRVTYKDTPAYDFQHEIKKLSMFTSNTIHEEEPDIS